MKVKLYGVALILTLIFTPHIPQVTIKEPPKTETKTIKPVKKIKTEVKYADYKGTGCARYQHLFEKYDWNVRLMMAIAQGESGCNTNAVGDNYPIAGLLAPSCGLLQIRTLSSRPSCQQLKNPEINIDTAYKIYKSQGLHAWTVYSKGIWRNYY